MVEVDGALRLLTKRKARGELDFTKVVCSRLVA